MIKLILLDVDGVVTGFKKGINAPFPSSKVTTYLKNLQNTGVIISLCTGKVSFAIKKIIQTMDLNNFHITDGGAVILDPIDDKIIKNVDVPGAVIGDLLRQTKDTGILWELYTLSEKYVDGKLYPPELQESAEIMPWKEVPDLLEVAKSETMTKVELKYAPQDELRLRSVLATYEKLVDVQWTYAMNLLPLKIAIITAKGVSKRSARDELFRHYHIQPSEVLGVGDTKMDWGFIEGCGYVATMGNANDEMKQLITDHHGYIGGHVDDDGLIDVLNHYTSDLQRTT